MPKLLYEDLTYNIRSAAIEVHKELGPGSLESAYQHCLCYELQQRGIEFQKEVELPVQYKGKFLDCGYRMDIVVENKVILELKSIDQLQPIHTAQLMTYLRLSKKPIGFLMNFNVPLLKDGIKRIAL